ncbi:stage II sporulation protein R [Paenibacillus sp.]|uniref:stage II sporulation protein R n=1 Tax=Paenibacillus sp. TaxID=58172 RepID=UPI002D6BB47C|nr:stage II sporulation protein R [Paenibacillus sp.]HZG55972.1 stage II sporulation protein R [Paenibacillus sp.]
MQRPSSSFSKTFVLILGMLAMLVMSWEYSKADPVLASAVGSAAADGVIPQESIRLRILADSDAPADQALKIRVRDAIVAEMNEWAAEPRTLDEARAYIGARLPELQALAAKTVADAGYAYEVKAELGLVPFPTKAYGGQLYPAGEYEALRITIGRGQGQNWWCVLFPPLCFVDVAAGETPAAGASVVAASAALTSGQAAAANADASNADASNADASNAAEAPKVEYRFFLVELVADMIEAVKGWL